jgi:hypothetical protein
MNYGLEKFYESVKTEEELLLATSAGGIVTMRTVSPVLYNDAILIFTSPTSRKYTQLKQNPNCALKVGIFFVEAEAEFLGATMLESNAALREVYTLKFKGAFDETLENNGVNAEFLLLKPKHIRGWLMDDNNQYFNFEYDV